MLCIHCSKAVIDYREIVDDAITIEYDRSDSHPRLLMLDVSAGNGCSLCGVLRDAIRVTWAEKSACTADSPEIVRIHKASFVTEGQIQSGLEIDENAVCRLEFQLSGPTISNVPIYFATAADEGSQAAELLKIRRRPISSSITSATCLGRINDWIEICREHHTSCDDLELPCLPSRVIDVGPADSRQDPHLALTGGAEGNYVALSHCWGPQSLTTGMLKTELESIADRLLGIPMASMPQNFRDAVTITRLLGLQYLWVDALCIIQDSKADWEEQGGKMSEIYMNAYITIVATSANTCNDGLLKRKPLIERRVVLPYILKDGTRHQSEFCVQLSDNHANPFEVSVDLAKWNTRGWTLQERYLSKRVVYFCDDQMYFECRTAFETESNEHVPFGHMGAWLGWNDMDPEDAEDDELDENGVPRGIASIDIEYLSTAASPGIFSPGEIRSFDVFRRDVMYERWSRFIGQYSSRGLTYESDKLPAISGIAKVIGSIIKDNYLAGLWEGDLIQGLLWRTAAHKPQEPKVYRGPSWSWVSLDGQITSSTHWNIQKWLALSRQSERVLSLVEAKIELTGSNPYGGVSEAILKISAKLVPVTFVCADVNNVSVLFIYPYHLFYEDIRLGAGDLDLRDAQLVPQTLWCLQVQCQPEGIAKYKDPWSSLLLEEVGTDRYRRVGVSYLFEEHFFFFSDFEARRIELI